MKHFSEISNKESHQSRHSGTDTGKKKPFPKSPTLIDKQLRFSLLVDES